MIRRFFVGEVGRFWETWYRRGCARSLSALVVAPNEPLGGTPWVGVTQIAAGYIYSCAVNTSNNVFCWGSNVYGQLGLGHTNTAWTPQQVHNSDGNSYLDSVEQVVGGYLHTCALKTDNTVPLLG